MRVAAVGMLRAAGPAAWSASARRRDTDVIIGGSSIAPLYGPTETTTYTIAAASPIAEIPAATTVATTSASTTAGGAYVPVMPQGIGAAEPNVARGGIVYEIYGSKNATTTAAAATVPAATTTTASTTDAVTGAATTTTAKTTESTTDDKKTETKKSTAKKSSTVTVKSGDTLSEIAAKHGTTWQKLYKANKGVIGSNPNLIKPGQKLKIP